MTEGQGRLRVRRRGFAWAVVGTVVGATCTALVTTSARGQSIRVGRARTLVVGAPGGSRADRVDAARTGLARTPLPASGLRVEWRVAAGTAIDDAPLVDSRGGSYVVGTRGEVVALARDGTERWRVPTGALDPGPAVLLSDDTIVFADASGEAIGLREGEVRWRTRFGRADGVHPSPLPLEEGGVVVATERDLAVLDAEGRPIARTTLPEAIAAPLLSALGQVVAVTMSGAVWGWAPGTSEATRLASFGSPIEGGAALADGHTLVAIAANGTTFAAVDLRRVNGSGAAVPRAVATAGLWLGSPAMRGEEATLAMIGPASELAIAVDADGRELRRALLVGHVPSGLFDAGAPASGPASSGAPLLVDAFGAVAFATIDGSVGIAAIGPSGDGTVELLSDACPRPIGPATSAGTVAGLAPLPPQSFLATCRSGTVLAITGGGRPRN